MINNFSTVEGLAALLGSWIIHLAALINLIVNGRPPQMPGDDDLSYKAKSIVTQLVISHSILAIFTFRNAMNNLSSLLPSSVCILF